MTSFYAELIQHQDLKYRDFNAKLIPNVPIDTMIGVRTPVIRSLAKSLRRDCPNKVEDFIRSLPHAYYEENNLHAFFLEQEKDLETLISLTEAFLPYVDNWATCDLYSPKQFKKHPARLLEKIHEWIRSSHTYTVRYAIGLLLSNYLDEHFDVEHLLLVASVESEEYYVKMMVAWYFSIALVKQYETTLPYIQRQVLEPWTHNKAIQKARESFRIPPERKEELQALKIKYSTLRTSTPQSLQL